MLSYYFCIKTLSPVNQRNEINGSGNESHLRGPICLKNSWRVTVYMARFTKLILHIHLTLDLGSIIGNGSCRQWFFTSMYKKPLITCLGNCFQQAYVKQRPKYTNGGILGTMRHPKGRKLYGNGDSVRESGRRCFSSATNIIGSPCVGLEELKKVNKENLKHINDKLIHIVSNVNTLILAYESIKNNPNNFTPDINPTTMDKIDLEWFHNISNKLKTGKYNFSPARRSYIPKSGNEKKKRPLTISSPRDKIVQKAILFILEAIYEPSFLEYSHGSRPGKGTHTALKYIKYKFNKSKWCIEADIENNFPNINHKILMNLLKKRITCPKFLSLIKNSIKAGYVEEGKFFESNIGLFQGNITSPILNNVYLHELDLYMNRLINIYHLGKRCKKKPEYIRFQYLMEKAKSDSSKMNSLRKQRHKVNNKDLFDRDFKRLYYVRYVDSFVVGVIGSLENTVELKEKVKMFLKNELRLTLNSEKTLITNFSKRYITFLGTYIKSYWKREKKQATVKRKGVTRKEKVTPRTIIKAPIKLLFEKATLNGFFKKRNNKFVPTYVGRCINLDHEVILRYYNSIIRKILNYYFFTDNRKSLGSLIHGLKFSCARTLALKYKLRYVSRVFRKFGTNLKKSRESKIELYIPKTWSETKAAMAIDNRAMGNPHNAIYDFIGDKMKKSFPRER
jgi:group II intron reverse transcriptase/maturase